MFPSRFLQFPSILTHFHAANEKIQNGGRDLAISRGLVWVSKHPVEKVSIGSGNRWEAIVWNHDYWVQWGHNEFIRVQGPGGRFKNAYELLNLRAVKIPMLYKNRIFQCMSKIFCVEFQRVPLKFHTKYLTHTLKDVNFIHRWNFKSS